MRFESKGIDFVSMDLIGTSTPITAQQVDVSPAAVITFARPTCDLAELTQLSLSTSRTATISSWMAWAESRVAQ
jgi:hypothetical protein